MIDPFKKCYSSDTAIYRWKFNNECNLSLFSEQCNLCIKYNYTNYFLYEFALCFGTKLKLSGTGPRSISVSLIQSEQSGDAIKVSRSSLPMIGGGLWLIAWGWPSKIPTGTYRNKNESHSNKNFRVFATPCWSLPQCSKPCEQKRFQVQKLYIK